MFSEAIDVGVTLIEHRKKLHKFTARLWSRLRKGHVRVIVIGNAGSGKSTLGKLLQGDDIDGDYAGSSAMEEYALDSATSCSILVPPGEDNLRASTWTELARMAAHGQSTIVVHVVCWGLTSFEPLRMEEITGFEQGMDPRSFIEAHAEHQRRREVEALADFAAHLKLAPGQLSLVTVVTKQDLWWDSRTNVRTHYEHGPYADVVARLRAHLGEQHFGHKTWSASLISKNLRDGAGVLLAPTTAGYDEPTRAWHVQRLMELISKEVGHG